MFMTYNDRDKVNEVLIPYRMWAYNDAEYTDKEAEFIITNELESEICELKEKVRILELAKSMIQDEGL